jgi:hypothetical protein
MNGTEELQFIDTHDKVDAALARVGAIRDALGPDFGIAWISTGACTARWPRCWRRSWSPSS